MHLTPKPNGKWRFNVDYRALNKYTKAARALIPNIAKLLRYIGEKNLKRQKKRRRRRHSFHITYRKLSKDVIIKKLDIGGSIRPWNSSKNYRKRNQSY